MTKSLILRSLLFIFGLLLFLDGLILVLEEKIHLGTVLPLFIGAGLCLYVVFYKKLHCYLAQHKKLNILFCCFQIGFVVWLISVAGFFIYLDKNIQYTLPSQPIDAMIVLGSGTINGQPSPTLAARLDQAALLHQQFPQALIIVTGGVGYAKHWSEAQVMSNYLQQRYQIPATQIALEDQSTSTELNLKNSQAVLFNHHLNKSAQIAIVTSDFHTLRAAAIARKQGYPYITVVSAPTPLNVRYNAWLREYFAYLSGWILREY